MKSQFPDTIKGSQTKIGEIENALKTANDPTNESVPQLNQVQDEVDKEQLRLVKSQELVQGQSDNNQASLAGAQKNGLKSEIDINSKLNTQSGVNDVHESVRDLDLSRKGFREAALQLDTNEFNKVIIRDDLKCKTEDEVLELIIEYIQKIAAQAFESTRQKFLPNVRFDQLSTQRLIALSKDKSGMIKGLEDRIIDALCVKLGASAESPGLAKTASHRSLPRQYTHASIEKGSVELKTHGPDLGKQLQNMRQASVHQHIKEEDQQDPGQYVVPPFYGGDGSIQDVQNMDLNESLVRRGSSRHDFKGGKLSAKEYAQYQQQLQASKQHVESQEKTMPRPSDNSVPQPLMESIETNKLMNPNDSIMSQKLGHNDSLAKIQDSNQIRSEQLDAEQQQVSNELQGNQEETREPQAQNQMNEQGQDVRNLYGKSRQQHLNNLASRLMNQPVMQFDDYVKEMDPQGDIKNMRPLDQSKVPIEKLGKAEQFNQYFKSNMDQIQRDLESKPQSADQTKFLRDDAVQILLVPPKSSSPLVIANPPSQHYQQNYGYTLNPAIHSVKNHLPRGLINQQQPTTTETHSYRHPSHVDFQQPSDQDPPDIPIHRRSHNTHKRIYSHQTPSQFSLAPQYTRTPSFMRQEIPYQPQIAFTSTLNQPMFDSVPQEFVYDHDFDRNGALFYLGSMGYQTQWLNPDIERKQVRAFASSIGAGRPSDIVGRQSVNCHTLNEAFAFMGIQFSNGRKILPTCYSLRNRNASSYAMLSWRFEGSNDLINWQLLDTRLHSHHEKASLDQICQKGKTSTWGIDQTIYEQIGYEGFTSFRVVQIEANSGQTHNMSLSGLEIYGRPTNPDAWRF